MVLPIAATIVAVVFSLAAWREARGRGPALAVWSFALAQFAVAAGALSWGVAFGWTSVAYRVFYLFGAVLNVVWLGLGTIWLLGERRVASVSTGAAIGLSGFALFIVATAVLISPSALATDSIPAAADLMPVEVRVMARVFSTIGSVVVLGGLAVSLVRVRRHSLGLALLAGGVVVIAVVSSLARSGRVEFFSMGLAVGVAVMYAGFIKAS